MLAKQAKCKCFISYDRIKNKGIFKVKMVSEKVSLMANILIFTGIKFIVIAFKLKNYY